MPKVKFKQSKSISNSFDNALNGIKDVIIKERNMKIHLFIAILVILTAFYLHLTRIEVMILIIIINLVFITELINTSLERIVDLLTLQNHPLAKLAKDIAAGSVLVAAFNSVIIGYLLFYKPAREKALVLHKLSYIPSNLVAFILAIVILTSVFIKVFFAKRGTPMRGGFLSGHAAVSFSAATLIFLLTNNLLVFIIALFIAFLVIQSRVEGNIHYWWEVTLGAIFGIFATILIFNLLR